MAKNGYKIHKDGSYVNIDGESLHCYKTTQTIIPQMDGNGAPQSVNTVDKG
jgi:hypothetical protein